MHKQKGDLKYVPIRHIPIGFMGVDAKNAGLAIEYILKTTKISLRPQTGRQGLKRKYVIPKSNNVT